MDIDEILLTAEEAMGKAVDYVKGELRGVRTGRANTGLVEYVKVDYYGAQTDLRSLALISVPEPTQILVKPFDASSIQAIAKAIETAGMGLNPQIDGKQIRLVIPSLSGERRKQMITSVKQMGEQAKVTIRNARRDANKHIDQAAKDKANPISEDEAEGAKTQVQDTVKAHESQVDSLLEAKVKEIEEV